MNQKREVKRFCRKYGIRNISKSELERALAEQGYTIIDYNGILETDDVAQIIGNLDLNDYIQSGKGFVYADDTNRLVFVHEELTDEERCVVLAHEIGHIWNGHIKNAAVLGDDVLQEYEASEFAHYLLKPYFDENRKTKKILSVVCGSIALLGIILGIVIGCHNRSIYTENLYRTTTGTKYHRKTCMYIRDKKDIYRLTKEEFESGNYEPCQACLPDEE